MFFFSMPTHIIAHSIPHSILLQYDTVCLHTVSYTNNPTKYASQYVSQYAYTICLSMPIHYILDTHPHLSVSFTISKKIKKFCDSFVRKLFFFLICLHIVCLHTVFLAVCLTVCLTACLCSMPTHSILDTDPHLSVSFTISNLEIKY